MEGEGQAHKLVILAVMLLPGPQLPELQMSLLIFVPTSTLVSSIVSVKQGLCLAETWLWAGRS